MLFRSVVNAAHAEGKQVSICGEMAGDPVAAVLLLAMGFDSLSMNSTHLPKVKWLLRKMTMQHAQELLEEVSAMDNPQLIHDTLNLALGNLGLSKVLNPASSVQT